MANDYFNLFQMGDSPSDLEKQRALAQAIRGRVGEQEDLASLGQARASMSAISGHPALQALGKTQAQYANQMNDNVAGDQRMLAQAGEYAAGAKGRALDRTLKAQQIARARSESKEDGAPANDLYYEMAKKLGHELKPGSTNKQAREALTLAERIWQHDKAGAPKAVTGAEAAQIGTFDTATQAIDQLGRDWDSDTGLASGLMQYIPGSDAKQYSNKADVSAQVIGGILEEGKLGEADLPRYKAMMPQPGDSKETKEKKVATIKQLIGLKRGGKIQGLGQAGYDVSGFPANAAPAAQAAAPKRAIHNRAGKLVGYVHADGTEEMVD